MPKKNIKLLGGYPLIAYSIAASKLSKRIDRTIVSTDSKGIAEAAKKYGAEVPFLRPAKFATDKATDLDVFKHAIKWLEKNEGRLPDYLVQLRPTAPFRDPRLIDAAIAKILKNRKVTSLRSAHKLAEPPQKMFKIDAADFWTGFFPSDPRPEYYNLPRQIFPDAYHPNGYVDIVRPDFIKETGLLLGPKVLTFITPFVVETDQPEDFDFLEYYFQKYDSPIYDYLVKNFPKEK